MTIAIETRGDVAAPRFGPDLALVMELQELYASRHPAGSEPRARAQEQWRRAYFEALRQGLLAPAGEGGLS